MTEERRSMDWPPEDLRRMIREAEEMMNAGRPVDPPPAAMDGMRPIAMDFGATEARIIGNALPAFHPLFLTPAEARRLAESFRASFPSIEASFQRMSEGMRTASVALDSLVQLGTGRRRSAIMHDSVYLDFEGGSLGFLHWLRDKPVPPERKPRDPFAEVVRKLDLDATHVHQLKERQQRKAEEAVQDWTDTSPKAVAERRRRALLGKRGRW